MGTILVIHEIAFGSMPLTFTIVQKNELNNLHCLRKSKTLQKLTM